MCEANPQVAISHAPKNPFILFIELKYFGEEEYSKCKFYKEFCWEYTYDCSCCNFNLHNICASLPLTVKSEVHDHPLTRI